MASKQWKTQGLFSDHETDTGFITVYSIRKWSNMNSEETP
jgi:hypothetical protein